MQVDDRLNITLPPEMTKRIREKIAAGYYRNELEVIEDALDALEPFDVGIERWLIDEVVPAYDAMEKDPSRGLTIDQVRCSLAALHAKASKAG